MLELSVGFHVVREKYKHAPIKPLCTRNIDLVIGRIGFVSYKTDETF